MRGDGPWVRKQAKTIANPMGNIHKWARGNKKLLKIQARTI